MLFVVKIVVVKSARLAKILRVSRKMKRTNQYPKCDSSDIIADAKAIDRGDGNCEQELSVATFRNPGRFYSKDS
jgi:hypothetical protein